MTDPFDALRITDTPLDPRPEFAAELRRTIATTLENTMTVTDTDSQPSQVADHRAAGSDHHRLHLGAQRCGRHRLLRRGVRRSRSSAAWSATTAASAMPRSRSATAS